LAVLELKALPSLNSIFQSSCLRMLKDNRDRVTIQYSLFHNEVLYSYPISIIFQHPQTGRLEN
jgi:hypothetical protein